MIRFRFFAIVAVAFAWISLAAAQRSLGTYTSRYDNARTGQNRSEFILTPANVNTNNFGKVFSYAVDGQIYAQPLWAYKVNVPGKGIHNIVYVVTQMDSVYAFDAGGTIATPLWQDSFINLANGIGPVPCGTDGGGSDISCGVYPYYGITGTPVIDPDTNTMYLIARTYDYNINVGYQTLHALDIATGAEKFGGPVQITGSVPGNGAGSHHGVIRFNTLADIQRTGLLLLTVNGRKTIFIAWAGAAHGWIMAYDATSLTQNAIFATTPNSKVGGIWASGNGLAADSSGYIYAAVGDALFDADNGGTDYGDTLLKLNSALQVQDYFTPMDQTCRVLNDMDLGSSGPMILPPQGGAHPLEVIQSGKGGNPCDPSGMASIYLADQTNLGKYNATQDNIIQEVSGSPGGYWSNAAYWSNNTMQAIYYGGVTAEGGHGDYLKMYSLTDGMLSSTPIVQGADIFPIGATPTVSSNGNNNGIVWAIERRDAFGIAPGKSPAVLYAYNALNLASLYSSNQVSGDGAGCANKFQVPTVANGKVFVATQNELDVYGLRGAPPAVWVTLTKPCYAFKPQPVGTSSAPQLETIHNGGTSNLTISSITMIGLNASDFSQQNNCPSSLLPGHNCYVEIIFTPTAKGPRVAQLLLTDNAGNSPQNSQLTGVGN